MSDQIVARPPHRSRAGRTRPRCSSSGTCCSTTTSRARFSTRSTPTTKCLRSSSGLRGAAWPAAAAGNRSIPRSGLRDRTPRCHTRLDRIQVGARQVAIGAPSGSPPGVGHPPPAERTGSLPALATHGPCGKLTRSAGAMARDGGRMSEAIDPTLFRETLGHYPTGVAVVTAVAKDGNPAGMVVGRSPPSPWTHR
jgi:hypothetical protein